MSVSGWQGIAASRLNADMPLRNLGFETSAARLDWAKNYVGGV